MTILSKDLLPRNGPFVKFADIPKPLCVCYGGWPDRELYQNDIFFEFAEDLLDTMCHLAHINVPFDRYDFTQVHRSCQLWAYSAEFSLWAFHLSHCNGRALSDNFWLYEPAAHLAGNEKPTLEDFQHDLVETALFLAGKLNDIARAKRCFLIAGY